MISHNIRPAMKHLVNQFKTRGDIGSERLPMNELRAELSTRMVDEYESAIHAQDNGPNDQDRRVDHVVLNDTSQNSTAAYHREGKVVTLEMDSPENMFYSRRGGGQTDAIMVSSSGNTYSAEAVHLDSGRGVSFHQKVEHTARGF